MEITIIGLPQCGKTTIFNTLTKGHAQITSYTKSNIVPNIGISKVPEPRLDILQKIFSPTKVTRAEIKYIDIALGSRIAESGRLIQGEFLNYLSNADEIIHVVRSFKNEGIQHIEGKVDPIRDVTIMDIELLYSDLIIIDRRFQRIETELKSSKGHQLDSLNKEFALLKKIKVELDKEVPIWQQSLSNAEMMSISNYQFVTAKPMLFILNIGEDQIEDAAIIENKLRSLHSKRQFDIVALCGQLEMELTELNDTDAEEFRNSMGVKKGAIDQVITKSYRLLGLISFFTIVSSELRAWTIPTGTTAVKAAGKIHTDMEKGFIKAEVIHYDDFIKCGDIAEARKNGLIRIEGKEYPVQDGDIITFLFNV